MRSKSRNGAVSVPSMSKSIAPGRIRPLLPLLERLMRGCSKARSFMLAFVLTAFALANSAHGEGWLGGNWKFRRPIEAIWDAEHGSGEQLCYATFYTAGHAKPNGDDIRVATADGKLVPSRILDINGDRVRVVF